MLPPPSPPGAEPTGSAAPGLAGRAWRQLREFSGLSNATCLWPRWLVLRAVGVVFLYVFAGILREGQALVGPRGIAPLVAAQADDAELLRSLALAGHGVAALELPSARADLAAGLELLRTVDLRAQTGRVGCPTLVVHGARDLLCPPEAGQWLAMHLPNARLTLHERAAHAPFLSHPDWFDATLKDFLHG